MRYQPGLSSPEVARLQKDTLMSLSYAVLFKTHFWDEFTSRQMERLRARVGRGDIYVVIDETFAPAPEIPGERVIGVNKEKLAALALAPVTTHGSILWYNNDYPNYAAAAELPAYDYYISTEYDVTINTDLDALIDRLEAGQVDFLGFPIRKRAVDWPWYPMHEDVYGAQMLVYLACFGIYSKAGLAALLAARQRAGAAFRTGALRYWPHVEAFLPNEIAKAGLRNASLADYGGVDLYDWWPPLNETDLPQAADQAFIHPVLHGTKYVRSTIYHEPSWLALLRPESSVRRKLQNFSPAIVRPLIRAEIRRRLGGRVFRVAERLGLRPKWFATAEAGIATDRQETLPHNAG